MDVHPPLTGGGLHVYGPGAWHDEARIRGTADVLRKLRDAIDRVLTLNAEQRIEAFTSDGEGFDLAVEVVGSWNDLGALPYTGEIARSCSKS